MDVNKKSRAELKRFFVKNALPTESNFADLIDAALNQRDDGLAKPVGEALSVEAAGTTKAALRAYESFADPMPAWTLGVQDNTVASAPKGFTLSDRAGITRLFVNGADGTVSAGALTVSGAVSTRTLSASGAVTAAMGLTVTGDSLNVGTSAANAQRLTVWGALTANGGMSIPTGQTLSVGGLLTASAGLNVTGAAVNVGTSVANAQPLTVWGALTANNGLTVTGAAVNVGTSASNAQPLTVWGALTANNGLTVKGGLTVDSLTFSSSTGASFAALTTTGLLSANAGLTVTGAGVNVGTSAATAQPLTVWGALSANGNLTVKGTLAVDTLTNANTNTEFPAIFTASGVALITNGLLAALQGLNVTGAPVNVGNVASPQALTVTGAINANRGLTVAGGALTVGSVGSPQPLTVSGALTANAGLTVTGALLNANAGLTVSAAQPLTVNSAINANLGLTVLGGALNVGTTAANGQPLNVFGPLTANNRLTATSTVNLTPPPRSGVRLDRAFNQYLSIPATSVNLSGGFTIQAWVYVTAYGTATRILDFSADAQNNNILFGIDIDGFLFGQVLRGTVAGSLIKLNGTPGLRVPLNTWTHVAFSVDQNGSPKMYFKGTLGLSYSPDASLIPNNVSRSSNYLGRSNFSGDAYFSGFLAEVSLWNFALPPASITTASPTGSESGLVGYWRMNETSGTTAVNAVASSGVGNATLMGTSSLPVFSSTFDRAQQTTISQEDWITPTLGSSLAGQWKPHGGGFNSPGYFKDSFGVVHLRGLIDHSSGLTLVEGRDAGLLIMQLPIGYRPVGRELLACIGGNAAARIDILVDGNVYMIAGNSTWISLDGLTFRTVQ